MAAFLSRTVDGVLKRGSRRAALDQFWTTQNPNAMGLTSIGASSDLIRSDGADLWKAADLTPLGFFDTAVGTGPFGACSDGINFWVVLSASNQLVRF